MSDFEKISVSQLLVLSEIITELSLPKKEFIENKYLKIASNFGETLKFLKELGLVKIKNDIIVLSPSYSEFLKKFIESKHQRQLIQELLINNLIVKQNSFSDYIIGFFSQFRLKGDNYQYSPNTTERLKFSCLRNFLIDLELIYLDLEENTYKISEVFSLTFIELVKSQKLSLHEFMYLMQQKAQIGEAAELEIIKFEEDRLSNFPFLAKNIEHTAIENVMAGYDIKSFDGTFDTDGNPISRFIEVKAVVRWNYNFYWTKNEIEMAEFYKQNYYLYLLPVVGKNKFNLNALKIIKDPYSRVYKNQNVWARSEELIAFSLREDSSKSVP